MRLRRPVSHSAFTLIEMLVVVAVIALMVAILLPSLRNARQRARITIAHADLHHIAVAIEGYLLNYRDDLPPTYASCMRKQVTYSIPAELWRCRFLRRKDGDPDLGWFTDVFDANRSYRYRAISRLIMNGGVTREYSQIWVPEKMPSCAGEEGRWYPCCTDPLQDCGGRIDRCKGNVSWGPVRYAVWSLGPDARSPKFQLEDDVAMEGEFPLKQSVWLRHSSDTGIVTHFRMRNGPMHSSP